MRAEDKVVNYRPELAEQLQKAMEFALKLYGGNLRATYYKLVAAACKNGNDVPNEISALINEAAECFKDEFNGIELFEENYADKLKPYGIELVSTAHAANFVFEVYEPVFDLLKEDIDTESLTKSEKFMVENFFKRLKAPIHNPNIKIKDGETKCYYDKKYHTNINFERDLKMSVEYLQQNCQNTIEIFNTPDEPELDVADDNEDIEVGE